MTNTDNNVLNTDRIGPLLLQLALPSFIGMFVYGMYNVINTIFVGHYVGHLGIAGLSIVFPLQMLIIGFGMMVGIGGASLISRQLGAGDKSGAEKTLGNSISITIILSILIAILVIPFRDFWLTLIGASDDVLPYARDYLVIIFGGAFFGIFAQASLNLARAEGNARVGMIAQGLGALISIALSALFIINLEMGVRGAALATVTAQMASVIYMLSYYLTRSSYLRLTFRNLILNLKTLKDIFAIGEIGLDYSRNPETREVQKELLRYVLVLARETGLPVSMHCRDAHQDMMDILSQEMSPDLKGSVHGFSGDRAVLKDWLDLGFYISIGGKRGVPGEVPTSPEVINDIPLNRLLTESEGANGPADIVSVANKLASIRGITVEQIANVTTANLRRLLKL